MITEDTFLPLPSEWFDVCIKRLSSTGRFLILSLSNDDDVVCIPKAITESPGLHKLCLPPGTTGAARIEIVDGKFRALEAQFEGTPPTEEIGQVIRWDDDRMRGHVERPCKDWLFIASTDGREGTYGIIRLGDWVRFRLERSTTRSGYVGISAHKIDAPTAQERKV